MQSILLLHGAIGAADQLQHLAHLLNDRFTVHTFNFSGHGGEPFRDAFSIPQFARELDNYISEHQIQSPSVFGYSMGGYVAMYYAKHYPGRINKIVTLGTKFYWDEEVAAREIRMLDAEKIELKIPAFAAELAQRHAPNDWKIVLAKTRELMLVLGRHEEGWQDDFSPVSTPSLLLLGENDTMVSREETEAVQATIPNAEFRLLPNTPHPIGQVDMSQLNKIIGEFFI